MRGAGSQASASFRHPIPREAVFLAAPPKRSTPEVGHVMPERRERPAIFGYRIIGEVACNDLPQPVSLSWDSLVHSLPQLSLDFLQLCPHAVAPGLPVKLKGAPSRFSSDEGEAQASEGFRSADTALLATAIRVTSDSNQARLVRVERQRECLEPLVHPIH